MKNNIKTETPAIKLAKAKYRAAGRQIACVIRDPDALDALSKLESAMGGLTNAVTHAIKSAKPIEK